MHRGGNHISGGSHGFYFGEFNSRINRTLLLRGGRYR